MRTPTDRYTRDSRWNPKSNTLQPDKAATWPHRHLCYRPVAFSRHLPLTALLFPQRKNSARVKICVISVFLYFSKIVVKLCNLHLCQTGSVCIQASSGRGGEAAEMFVKISRLESCLDYQHMEKSNISNYVQC
jgi:hypothetical protein